MTRVTGPPITVAWSAAYALEQPLPMRHRTIRYLVAASLATASLFTLPSVQSAGAATGPVQVTLTLDAPHPAALAALAASTGESTAVRRAKLAAMLPSETTHATVAQVLTSKGFRILNESSWTITVTAPQNVVQSIFGILPVDLSAVTGTVAPYPHVPTALAGMVRLASPTRSRVPAWHSSVIQSSGPTALRNAYTAPGVAPGAGKGPRGPLTIATIQFSSWNSNDLTRYAALMHRPDPVATHQLRTVLVDGGATDSGGQVEVGLDQEGILAASPYSTQQLYSAPNTTAGFNDAFSAVLDDVLGTKHATARNPRIAAISTSWGGCEALTGVSNMASAEPILQSLVAAGVNIFAPTGDAGIYDCDAGGTIGTGGLLGTGIGATGPVAAVDFPASSPYVIGVGGTLLASATATPARNNGHNWAESAWSCASQSECDNNGGTGGGQSTVFGSPAYQRTYIRNAPFAGTRHRLLPDIAAVADPSSGLTITTSDPSAQGGQMTVGGTSLATPVSAALFVDLLASLGRTRGVGDLHPGIYRAAAAGRFVRDVRAGTNGADTDRATNPRVTAGVGYDTLTGVGSVLWSGLAPYLPR